MERTIDREAVRELDLYAENTHELYGQFQSIIRNLQHKIAAGRYQADLAPKLWRYWYDTAAKRYMREFGNVNDLGVTFPPAVRQQAAIERAESEYAKILNGEYDQ